jgi:hypothetical protein
MEQNEKFTEADSLRLITEMIQKAKGSHFHENGTGSILWGCVVGFCGLISFAQKQWNFYIGFDVWLLTLIALIPQIYVSAQDKKRRIVRSDMQTALDAVWAVYGLSIFALIFYGNIIGYTTDKIYESIGKELLEKDLATGVTKHTQPFAPSFQSLLMIIYALPTLVTGIARKFLPMTIGAIFCYCFFIISVFTQNKYDMLLGGFAAIGNWLIPGLILRNKYNTAKKALNV